MLQRYGPVFSVCLCILCGCGGRHIEEDFVIFDQAYVTAIVTTSQDNPPLARQAMENLTITWDEFKAGWYGALPSDTGWQAAFDTVGTMIAAAGTAAAAGSTQAAYRRLDAVAPVLCRLRRRNGIEYFLDYLTAFKKELTALNAVVKGKTPAALAVTDIISLEKTYARADTAWRTVTSAPFDKKLFKFCKLNVTYLKNNIARERRALDSLGDALARRHKSDIIRYLGEANSNYNRLFIVFGNFGCLSPESQRDG